MHAVGRGGAQEQRVSQRRDGQLTQARDVIEYPDRAAMGRQDEIVLMDPQIAHRGVRQIQLQRAPVITLIKGDPYRGLGGRKEQATALRIFAHRIRGRVRREARDDRLPGAAAVARTVEVGMEVIDAHTAH
jgi:hypothetical protein